MNKDHRRRFRFLSFGTLCLSACLSAFLVSTPTTLGAVLFSNDTTRTPQITFGEVTPLTSNPVFDIDGTTVSFGSIFDGQIAGTNPNTLIDSSPNNPLQLDLSGPAVATTLDLSNPTFMVLGSAGYRAPIAMLFADPVNRVEFTLGHLDGPGTTRIEAYDWDGNSLGLFQNQQVGLEHIALFDDANRNVIAGVSLFVSPGAVDWEGFAIDDVAFVVVPEPASLALWPIVGLMGLLYRRQRRCR